MKNLQEYLEELQAHSISWGAQPGSWSRIGIVEEAAIRREKEILNFAASALSSPDDYAVYFDVLMMRGYSWLNMNAAGILDHALLVIIELPNYVTEVIGKTSINFSGPPLVYGESMWDATDRIFLE